MLYGSPHLKFYTIYRVSYFKGKTGLFNHDNVKNSCCFFKCEEVKKYKKFLKIDILLYYDIS